MECPSCGNRSDFTRKPSGVCCDYCGTIATVATEPPPEQGIPMVSEGAQEVDFAAVALAQVLPVVSSWALKEKSIHLAPDIPAKKLGTFLNACTSGGTFAWLEQCAAVRGQQAVNGIVPMSQGIFAQVDCTVFGSGKDSLVFAWGGLAYKEMGEDPAYVTWESIAAAVRAGQRVTSVGIVNRVFRVGATEITLCGSDVSEAMLGELIAVLNTL